MSKELKVMAEEPVKGEGAPFIQGVFQKGYDAIGDVLVGAK